MRLHKGRYRFERDFQSDTVSFFRARGALVLNVMGHARQGGGWPDLQIYHGIWTGHLELKIKDTKLSPKQYNKIKELRLRGTKAYVLRWDTFFIIEDEDGNALHDVIFAKSDSKKEKGERILRALAEIS